MNNSEILYNTNIDIKARLKNRESKFLDEIIKINRTIGRTPQQLIEFIFKVGLEFIIASFSGFSAAMNNPGLNEELVVINPEKIKKLLEDSFRDEMVVITKCYLDDREIEFFTSPKHELCFKENKKLHKIRIADNCGNIKVQKI